MFKKILKTLARWLGFDKQAVKEALTDATKQATINSPEPVRILAKCKHEVTIEYTRQVYAVDKHGEAHKKPIGKELVAECTECGHICVLKQTANSDAGKAVLAKSRTRNARPLVRK